MSFLPAPGKTAALAALFTIAAMAVDHEQSAVHNTPAPHRPESASSQSSEKCHDMILNQLGLFKDYRIILSSGQAVTINQWTCFNESKQADFATLGRQSFPGLYADLWNEDGAPVPMTITRTPM